MAQTIHVKLLDLMLLLSFSFMTAQVIAEHHQHVPQASADAASPGSQHPSGVPDHVTPVTQNFSSTSDYRDYDRDYDDDYDGDTGYDDPNGQSPPPPPHGLPVGLTTKRPADTPQVLPGNGQAGSRKPIMCTSYDGEGSQSRQTAGRGRHSSRRNGVRRWRRRRHVPDDQVSCNSSCFTLWRKSKKNISMVKQGCSANYCNTSCSANASPAAGPNGGSDSLSFFCCCNTDGCNDKIRLESELADLATGRQQPRPGQHGVTPPAGGAAEGGSPEDGGGGKRRSSTKRGDRGGYRTNSSKRHRNPHEGPVIDGDGHLCAFFNGSLNGASHRSTRDDGIELSKRYPPRLEEGQADHREVYAWDAKGGRSLLGVLQSKDTILCKKSSFCFTLFGSDARNKSRTFVLKQGCWLKSDEDDCVSEACEARDPPHQNNTHFCCCRGNMCNTRFRDVYDPTKHTTTTTTTRSVPEAVGPIRDHSYREKTIAVALVLLLSISLVIVLSYLVYRLCMTSKRATPLSSSAGTRTDTDMMDITLGAAPPHFDADNLKILDVIVRGRYSEVRRGTLEGKDVAVKIYQHHQRQYFFNERSAFTLPFMENKNLVKFYGAAERLKEDRDADGTQQDSELELGLGGDGDRVSQYVVVTELAPLGSLTGYLKHNTVDWYRLCHMCQDICQGLVHLHTDISKGGLFKPAIAHRDVNTRNILVKSDLSCVIADLGFAVGIMGSKIIRNGVAEIAEQSSIADVGTLRYMAPEVFDGAVNLRDCEASLKQIDVYALGLVIWEVASRCVDLYQGAVVPEYQLPFQAEAGSHPLFEELQVLVVKYKTRPKFPQVWKDTHPAVSSLKETIEDCWDSDAEARLTALCVQERIVDMAALWLQGNIRKRDMMPTLNSDLWSSDSRTSVPCVVSNGMSVLLSIVNETPTEGGLSGSHQGKSIMEDVGRDEVRTTSSIGSRPGDNNSHHRPLNSSQRHHGSVEDVRGDEEVTAPLINSNLNRLVGDEEESSSEDRRRVRAWLQDQSLSGSTMDTLLPMTPLSDLNPNLMEECPGDRHSDNHRGSGLGHSRRAISPFGSRSVAGQTAIKANNVILAQNHGIISHPNQGRNPTVERNTHKRSDEELTVQGNQLIGTLDSHSSAGSETLGPLAKRKGSLNTHSALAGQTRVTAPGCEDDSAGGNIDGPDNNAGEHSSLVQHDLLNDTHTRHHHRPATRNAPIPYVQNQVYQEGDASLTSRSGAVRPKLANASARDNRNSYLPNMGEKGDSFENKSLKNVLGKFIRPKDLGHKFSLMVFGGGKKKKNQPKIPNTAAGGNNASHYDNSGLEASPLSRNSNASELGTHTATVPMQVELRNGAAVTSTVTRPSVNVNVAAPPRAALTNNNRLSATDVRQVSSEDTGGQGDSHFPSLFPCHQSQGSSASSGGSQISVPVTTLRAPNLNDNCDQSTALLQRMSENNRNDNLSLTSEPSNREGGREPPYDSTQLLGCIALAGVEQACDQNHNSPVCSMIQESNSSPCKCESGGEITQPTSLHTEEGVSKPGTSISSSMTEPGWGGGDCSAAPATLDASSCSVPDTKGGNSIMHSISTKSDSRTDRPAVPTPPGASHQNKTSPKLRCVSAHSNSPDPVTRTLPSKRSCKSPELLDNNEALCPEVKHHGQNFESQNTDVFHESHGNSGDRKTASDLGCAAKLPMAGMSISWHEEGLRQNYNPGSKLRPKSLSLKGHEYKRSRQPLTVEAKAASGDQRSIAATSNRSSMLSCPLDTSPDKQGTDQFKDCPLNQVHQGKSDDNVTRRKNGFHPSRRSKKMGGENGCGGIDLNRVDLSGDGTIPVVVPNVVISATTSLGAEQQTGISDPQQQGLPSVCVLSTRASIPAAAPLYQQTTDDAASGFKPIDAPVMPSPSHAAEESQTGSNPDHIALPSSQSTGQLKAGASLPSHGHAKWRRKPNSGKNIQTLNGESCGLSAHPDMQDEAHAEDEEVTKEEGAKIKRACSTSSDSSEKIRRRIKTPVSFKNGRLSLYDDRLMSQSLDSAAGFFYTAAGEEV